MLTARYIRTPEKETSQGLNLTLEEDFPSRALCCNCVYQVASEKSWESTLSVRRGTPDAHRPVAPRPRGL